MCVFVVKFVLLLFGVDGVIIGSVDFGLFDGGVCVVVLVNFDVFFNEVKFVMFFYVMGNVMFVYVLKVEVDIVKVVDGLCLKFGKFVFQMYFFDGGFGNLIKVVMQVVVVLGYGGVDVVVVCLLFGSFDMYINQLGMQVNLLCQLGEGMVLFKSVLIELGCWNDMLIVMYLEFGCCLCENLNNGMDYGMVVVYFVVGGCVKGGLVGQGLVLECLDGGGNFDLLVDFCLFYVVVLECWWGMDF